MILALQTCLCVPAGKPALGQMLSVCSGAKEVWDDVGNGGQLRTPLQTQAEEWGGWWSSSWMHHRVKSYQAENEIRLRMKEWLKPFWKGVWMDSSSKKTLVWEGSGNQDILNFYLVPLAYFFVLGLFRVSDFFWLLARKTIILHYFQDFLKSQAL